MSGLILPVLTLLTLCLFALVAMPRAGLAARGIVGLCGLGALLDIVYLIVGAPPASLALPIGLPGAGVVLALDGLSGFVLLLVLVAAVAAALASLDHDPGRSAPALPPFIAGMILTLIAGDAFSLLAGFEAMSLASFALVLTRDDDAEARAAALLYLGMAVLGAACLVAAFALLASPGTPIGEAIRFATLRAHPPAGWRAGTVLALVLIGAGAKAGLAPLHVWLPPAHAAAPAHVSALMSGAMTKVALYVIVRVLLDLCGPAQPLWWSVPVLVLGSAGAVLGGLRANMEPDLKTVLACSTIENVGLITIGLGIAIAARATDLTPLAALALGGALLHLMAHGTFKSLLFLCVGAAQHGAGTRTLARLGGLIHRMPITTACTLVGAAALAALPPSSGFAGEWTLFQAILGAPRVGELAFQIIVCVVAALMALAAALAAAAAIRLVGVAFLGRPRSPRAAAATEAGRPLRVAMIGLAALTGLIGLFPTAVLALASPAIRLLLPGGLGDRVGVLTVTTQPGTAGYTPVGLALLLGLAAALAIRAIRRRTSDGYVYGPAWDCGYGAPPPWMPFGDPATQYGGASFSEPLRRALGGALLSARAAVDMPEPGDTRPAKLVVTLADPAAALLFDPAGRLRAALSAGVDRMAALTVRRTLGLMFSALVFFLAVVALVQQL